MYVLDLLAEAICSPSCKPTQSRITGPTVAWRCRPPPHPGSRFPDPRVRSLLPPTPQGVLWAAAPQPGVWGTGTPKDTAGVLGRQAPRGGGLVRGPIEPFDRAPIGGVSPSCSLKLLVARRDPGAPRCGAAWLRPCSAEPSVVHSGKVSQPFVGW